MMENRSFDSYLGWLSHEARYLERGRSRYGAGFHVDGNQHQTYQLPNGTPVNTSRPSRRLPNIATSSAITSASATRNGIE